MCVGTSFSSEPRLEAIPPPAAAWAAPSACIDRDGLPRGILAVVDAGAGGTHAAWRAALVARDHGRPLHLVTIQPRARDALAAKPLLQDLAGQLEQRIQVRATTAVVAGALRECLVELAAHRELVVVPWQRSASWSDKVLGTPPERMLRWLAAPLLIVRRPATASYRRVLAPVKLEAGAEPQIAVARYLARGQGLRVLHVLDEWPEGSLRLADASDHTVSLHRQRRLRRAYQEMNALIDRTGVGAAGAAALISFGHVPSRVLDAARGHNAQLIVAGTGRRSVFADVVCGGLVQDLVRQAEADVLVVPVQEARGSGSVRKESRHAAR